jgi:hypothetical protein
MTIRIDVGVNQSNRLCFGAPSGRPKAALDSPFASAAAQMVTQSASKEKPLPVCREAKFVVPAALRRVPAAAYPCSICWSLSFFR